jgi:1-acyl-sn-glycerol-3-phosphate acyltransferase
MNDWQYRPAGDFGLPPNDSFRSVRREAGLISACTQAAWRIFVRAYLGGYHRLRVEGREHLPAGAPFVMIANHASHLDVLTLGAALPWRLRRLAFPIAAGDVFFETPAASLFSAMMLNALPMWRKRCGPHAMRELRERLLGDPGIYLLFPEGTRSRDGTLGKFKPGLGMLIAGSPAPVVPCHLHGTFAAMPPGRHFPAPAGIRLRVGVPLDFSETTNDRAGWEQIAATLEAAVGALARVEQGR